MEMDFAMVRTERGRRALLALCATAAFSFAAHGFLFTNEFFSHDSVSYFTYATGTPGFYTGIGRFCIPVYEQLKGAVAAPWLIGLLFIFWMTLTALLVTELLELRSGAAVILTSGLLCTNAALTLTGATYIYCMDEYAFALCAAAAAAWLFGRGGWRPAAGLGLLVVSLAVYQPYFTVAAILCLLPILRRLADNEETGRVLRAGFGRLGLLAAGFGLYYGFWTALCAAFGVEKQRVGESVLSGGLRQLPRLVLDANRDYVRWLFDGQGVLGWLLPALHALLLVLLVWRLLRLLTDRALSVGNKVLLALLACLLPTALNSVAVLMAGNDTGLMTYGWELLYLLVCREGERRAWKRPLGLLLAAALCIVLWQHTVFANQVYMKKDLDKNATLVLAARVLDRIELTEGYVPGETPVAFVGRLDRNETLNRGREAFSDLDGTVGLWSDYAATYNLGRYLTDYLNAPLLWDTVTDFSQQPDVAAMPVFPAADSVQMIQGTVVVKLS